MAILEIIDLKSGYGEKQVLFGVSLVANAGTIVGLIGPNGAGKSTVLKTVCGLIHPWGGDIRFESAVINTVTPAANVVGGIAFVPQGNRVFGDLSILENLQVGGHRLERKEVKERIESVLVLFPQLRPRLRDLSRSLSGGEQQMVALARALILRPRLLMLDEPSLGLSPKILGSVFDKIVEINREMRITVLIVEQKVRQVLKICNHVYSLKLGKVEFEGTPDTLIDDPEKLANLFL